MSHTYAMAPDPELKAKIQRLLALYSPTISPAFYKDFRFPAYVYDKINIGLIDAFRVAGLTEAKGLFKRTAETARQHLPERPLSYQEQMSGAS